MGHAAPAEDPRHGIATTAAPCPGGIKGDCVYAVSGGISPVVTTNEAYSTETNAWLTLPPIPTARASAAAATAPCPEGLGLRGACVYVFGGNDLVNPVHKTVQAYSPATNTWATLRPMQTARVGHGGAAAPCPGALGLRGTCVYAFGGGNEDSTYLSSAEVYSPVTNTWMYLPDMPSPRWDGPGGASAPCPDGMTDGCVYALGGLGTGPTLDTVDAYSPFTNVWVSLPSMPTPHREFAAEGAPCPKNTKRSCVYAVGGATEASGAPSAIVEAFAIEHTPAKHHPKPKPSDHTKPSDHPKPSGHTKPSDHPKPPADDFEDDDLLEPAPGDGAQLPKSGTRDTPPPPVVGLPYRPSQTKKP